MVELNLAGGFGNVLYSYCIGALFCSRYNIKMYINWHYDPNDTDFKRKDTRSCLQKILNPNIVTSVKSDLIPILITSQEHCCKIYENLDITANKVVIYCTVGFDISYLYKNKDILLRYLNFDNIQIPIQIYPTDIVISIRVGMGSSEVSPDVFVNIHRLPFKYYENAIEEINKLCPNNSRFLICSDNFTDSYLSNFDKFDNQKIMCQYDTLSQFKIILNAPIFISSNSTFAIWGTVFTNASKIFLPRFNSGGIYRDSGSNCYTMASNITYIDI